MSAKESKCSRCFKEFEKSHLIDGPYVDCYSAAQEDIYRRVFGDDEIDKWKQQS